MRPGFHLYRAMRVGLLGGSFNPAHEGHAHVAETALKAMKLHRVLWLVSPQNPLKTSAHTAPLPTRTASARRQAKGPSMTVTDIEAALGSPYTTDTLDWLKRRYPGVRFFWLMGSDNLGALHHWRRWRDISRQAEVVIVPRPGSNVRGRLAPAGRFLLKSRRARFLAAPLNRASSTQLRERARFHP